MTHGNEVRGLLGPHHAGDLRDGQDIALGNLAPLNFFEGFRLEKDCGLSCRGPFGRAFGTDIDHARPPRLVEVRKFCHFLAWTIHDWLVRSSRPAGRFSFGLLDGLPVRLRRPYLREAPAGFGLERLATAFMNSPGYLNQRDAT